MPFRVGNLIVTVVHPHIDAMVPSPPLPPAASRRPTVPTLLDELRALLAHATAQLAGEEDASLAPPRTLTEATALVQYLEIALREAQQIKEGFASAYDPSDGGTRE
jgi:hypothetical protein